MAEKFKPNRNHQLFLLPPSIEDFIPANHLARVIEEIVNALDTSGIESGYSVLGQKSYHPKTILKLLIYAYSTGTFSGRSIAQKCESDTAYMYLASMYRPDFRTINDFRKDHISCFQQYFTQVIQIAQELGMNKVGSIAIDGTKISANASIRRTKDKSAYQKWLTGIKSEISRLLDKAEQVQQKEDQQLGNKRGDELPEALEKKQRLQQKIEKAIEQLQQEEKVNLTDKDAKGIKSKGQITCNYNCQGACSEDGLIVAAYVTNNASDKQQLLPAIEQAEANTGAVIKVVLADSGYASFENYQAIEMLDKVGYIPDQEHGKDRSDNRYDKSNFRYDKDRDVYTCPEKQLLLPDRIYRHKKRKQIAQIYKGIACNTCAVKDQCTASKARTIQRDVRDELRQKMRQRLDSQEGKNIYKQRMTRIEPIWGGLKFNKKFTRFNLRGLEKVNGEFMLLCMGHNIFKIHQRKLRNGFA